MKIIKNGNFTDIFLSLLVVVGITICLTPYFLETYFSFFMSPKISIGTIFVGLFIAAIGGHASQAKTWQIRPFGNLTFPRDKEGETPKEAGVFEKILNSILFIIIVTPFVLAVIDDTNKPLSENYGLMKIYLGVIFSFVIVYWGRKIYGKKQSKDKQDDSNR